MSGGGRPPGSATLDAYVFGEGHRAKSSLRTGPPRPGARGRARMEHILDYVVRRSKRNSGVPLLDLKGVRIEPGALIREKVKIGDNAVIMMGAIVVSVPSSVRER